MTKRQRPRGYIGSQHETRGSCIRSVFEVLKLPEQVLGVELCRRMKGIDPNAWYPVELLLDLTERLDKAVGSYGLLQTGRTVFQIVHRERGRPVASGARDVLDSMDNLYHYGNRGVGIGGWKLLRIEPGKAEIEKTTPHHCMMEQGMLSAALQSVGCPGVISQRECLRNGAGACVYTISSAISDERWLGSNPAP